MNLLNIEQHSMAWFAARLGNCTGSRVKDALSFLKRKSKDREAGESSQARLDYMMELALGRLTGIVPDHFVTQAMQWGIDVEPHAVRAYEAVTEQPARKVGIAAHPSIERFLASPDRYIGSVGVLEAKCPTSMVHMAYLKAGVVPPEYLPQCLSELGCDPTREWLDFISFDPRFTGPAIKLQLFIAPRMYREEWKMQIEETEEGVRKFLKETAALVADLESTPMRVAPILEAI